MKQKNQTGNEVLEHLFSYGVSEELALEAMYSSYIAAGRKPALTFRDYTTAIGKDVRAVKQGNFRLSE